MEQRFTAGLHHLVPQLFQFHRHSCCRRRYCPDSVSVADCVCNFTCIIDRENFRMVSRDFLHFCPQRDSKPSFTNVTVKPLQCSSNRSAVKVFGFKICQVRYSRGFRDFDFAFLCELLHPQSWSSNVPNPPGSSSYCFASSGGRGNCHIKYCFENFGVFTDVNSQNR